MDADFLRITLAVVGALLITGLYLWERRRHRDQQGEDYEEGDDRDGRYGEEGGSGKDEAKREPRLGVWGRDDGDLDADEGEEGAAQTGSLVGPMKIDPSLAMERFPPGPLLVVLHVVSRGSRFDGAAIVHASRVCGLEAGEREIFHCVLGDEDHSETLFSMANMVKPGTFPFGAMAEFETPGLTLFAQLDGRPGDPGRLEELLGTAHSLAKDLSGEVRDDKRQPLSAEGEERLRQRVMAFVTLRMAEEA